MANISKTNVYLGVAAGVCILLAGLLAFSIYLDAQTRKVQAGTPTLNLAVAKDCFRFAVTTINDSAGSTRKDGVAVEQGLVDTQFQVFHYCMTHN